MRHLASLAFLMLALSACATIPSVIRVEVDGSTLEFKKKAAVTEVTVPVANSLDAPAP